MASRAHLLRAHLSTKKRTARVHRRERTAPTNRDTPPIGTSMVSILKFPNHVPVAADIVADDIVCNLVGPVSDPSGRWSVIAILLVDNE